MARNERGQEATYRAYYRALTHISGLWGNLNVSVVCATGNDYNRPMRIPVRLAIVTILTQVPTAGFTLQHIFDSALRLREGV